SSSRRAHRANRRLASVPATPSRIRPSEAASVVPAVVHLPRPGFSDRSQLVPPRPELLQVVGVRLESVHPPVEPRVESLRLPSDLIPREVEGVVTVVIALDVARVAPARLLHDGVDDDTGKHGAVRVGAD